MLSRRQVLVGSLVLAAPVSALAKESNSKRVTDAMKKVHSARQNVTTEMYELTSKQGKVVMKAEIAPLAGALDGLGEARRELVTEWRAWSQGKHSDVDDKLSTLASQIGKYKATVGRISGILTENTVTELRRHDGEVRLTTDQVGDRITELTS